VSQSQPAQRFANVREAVQQAKDDFGETLVILSRAFRAAKDSPFLQTDEVYRALEGMDAVCKIWRQGKADGQSIGSLERAFEARGLTYAAHQSRTTMGEQAHEWEVFYKGRRLLLDEHLLLGDSFNPQLCLRIYFFRDEEKQVFVVGHVGKHKPTRRRR
jgi:hypothetical protein